MGANVKHLDPKSIELAIDKAVASDKTVSKTLFGTRGKSTQNGTGAVTAFTIAHGLGVTPTSVLVEPGNLVSAATHFVTADATNITVTFAAAPASGTGNVILNWLAVK